MRVLQPALRGELVQLSSGMVDQRKYESRDASSYWLERIDARLVAAVLHLEEKIGPDQHRL